MARTARERAAPRGALLALAVLAVAAATRPAAAQIGAATVPAAKTGATAAALSRSAASTATAGPSRAAASTAMAGPSRAAASPTSAAPSASAASSSGTDKVFKIGGLVPLTGNKADTGRAVQAAVEMAVRDAAPQRLPGYKVQTQWEDTHCEDVAALRGAAKLARSNVGASPAGGGRAAAALAPGGAFEG